MVESKWLFFFIEALPEFFLCPFSQIVCFQVAPFFSPVLNFVLVKIIFHCKSITICDEMVIGNVFSSFTLYFCARKTKDSSLMIGLGTSAFLISNDFRSNGNNKRVIIFNTLFRSSKIKRTGFYH